MDFVNIVPTASYCLISSNFLAGGAPFNHHAFFPQITKISNISFLLRHIWQPTPPQARANVGPNKKTANFCQQKLANNVGPSARRKALF